jgi:hypothetical protein
MASANEGKHAALLLLHARKVCGKGAFILAGVRTIQACGGTPN